MQISDTIKKIRDIRGETQAEFAAHFTNVSLAVQKAYELGRTEPKSLYITELSGLSGLTEERIKSGKFTQDDISIVKERVGKVQQVDKVAEQDNGNNNDSIKWLIDKLIEEKENRIKDLKEDKAFLQEILKTSLARIVEDQVKISESQGTVLAYQKAWVDQHAEEVSDGDPVIEKTIKAKMSSRVGAHELGPVHKDNSSIPSK